MNNLLGNGFLFVQLMSFGEFIRKKCFDDFFDQFSSIDV